jgi:hypothetical protein
MRSGPGRTGSAPDGLLNLAVKAVNMEAKYLEEDLREVARGRLWDELAEVY